MSALDHDTLAALELVNVPAGLCALDAVCKQAHVTILFAGDIDPSRFLIVFAGDLGAVHASLDRAIAESGSDVLESLLLPQAHLDLRKALHGELLTPQMAQIDEPAMGILQTHTVIATLAAVDRALKAADVQLMRLRMATELAGQGHAVLVGEQDDLEAALLAAQSGVAPGIVVQTRRIARPAPEVYAAAAQRAFGARAIRPLDG